MKRKSIDFWIIRIPMQLTTLMPFQSFSSYEKINSRNKINEYPSHNSSTMTYVGWDVFGMNESCFNEEVRFYITEFIIIQSVFVIFG